MARSTRLPRGAVLGPALCVLWLAGCTGGPPPPVVAGPPAPPTVTAAPTPTTPADVAPPQPSYSPPPGCRVTIPGSQGPPGRPQALFGWQSSHGNADLWAGGLGPGGVIVTDPTGIKIGWYRFAEGRLTITGRRLDGSAAPLRSSVPDGYGLSGFQSSGVTFPTGGCWEVTGAAGRGRLTIITYVVIADAHG